MDEPDLIEDLYGVYLLYSLNDKYIGRTYIGYTVDPARRISQHNKGCWAGGAKRTSRRGPWKMVLMIYGFPNNVAALRFEWGWQNPDSSVRLQHVVNKKKIAKESHIQYKIRILSEMLSVGPWKRLPLTVQWLEMEFYQDFPTGKFPPIHMPICYGPIQRKKSPMKSSQCSQNLQRSNENIFHKESNDLCDICKEKIIDNKLSCLSDDCEFTSHTICLADKFLEHEEYTEYIPTEGECPSCNAKLLWGDLIRKSRNSHRNENIFESEENLECDTSSSDDDLVKRLDESDCDDKENMECVIYCSDNSEIES